MEWMDLLYANQWKGKREKNNNLIAHPSKISDAILQ